MGMMDDPEELPMISSSPLLSGAPRDVKPQDEQDLPALKQIQALVNKQIAECDSNSTIDLSESTFTVKEQLALNRSLAQKLQAHKALVDTIINNIRGKYER